MTLVTPGDQVAAGHWSPPDGAAAVVGCSRNGNRQITVNGPGGPCAAFRIASLTKTVTAVAVVLACRRLEVPLDSRVLDLVPGLASDWHADPRLTVEEVLAQVS